MKKEGCIEFDAAVMWQWWYERQRAMGLTEEQGATELKSKM